MKRYRVAVIEPATVIGAGISAMLGATGEADVILACSSPSEAQTRLRGNDIDILFVALDLAPRIASIPEWEGIPIVAIQSALADGELLRRFPHCISTYATEEELSRTMHEALDSPSEMSYAESHDLSERERDVLILVARGFTNKEIASELNISPHTVISHRKNIAHKTGIRSVAGLTVYAVLNKLINSEQL